MEKTAEHERLLALLREFRTDAGLRQEDVANRLGKPQSYVSKFETGERRLDLPELSEVCRALGVSLVDFVRRFENSTPSRKKRTRKG